MHAKSTTPREILEWDVELATSRLAQELCSLWFGSKCTRGLLRWCLSGVSKKNLKKEEAAVYSGGQVADRNRSM